jgi:hypothetical protein
MLKFFTLFLFLFFVASLSYGQNKIAVVIGLDVVSKAYYDSSKELSCCVNDAEEIGKLLEKKNYQVTRFLSKKNGQTEDTIPRRSVVMNYLEQQISILNKSGGIFVVYYSGHGGSKIDTDGDEYDYKDETWCLYDGELIDDELYSVFNKLNETVKVIFISDSCHSGTAFKDIEDQQIDKFFQTSKHTEVAEEYKRLLNKDMEEWKSDTTSIGKDFWRYRQEKLKVENRDLKCDFISISACDDNETALAGTIHSLFTESFLEVFNNKRFMNYTEFFNIVKNRVIPRQNPQLTLSKNPIFNSLYPFDVFDNLNDSIQTQSADIKNLGNALKDRENEIKRLKNEISNFFIEIRNLKETTEYTIQTEIISTSVHSLRKNNYYPPSNSLPHGTQGGWDITKHFKLPENAVIKNAWWSLNRAERRAERHPKWDNFSTVLEDWKEINVTVLNNKVKLKNELRRMFQDFEEAQEDAYIKEVTRTNDGALVYDNTNRKLLIATNSALFLTVTLSYTITQK